MSVLFRWGCDRTRMCTAIAGLGLMLIACSAAIGGTAADHGILLDVKGARLGEVVNTLIAESGTNIVISGDVADILVTATLKDLPLETVLKNILDGAKVDYWKTDDGTYMIGSKKPVAPTPVVVAPPVVAPVPVVPAPAPVPVPAKVLTQVISLVNSEPVAFCKSLGLTWGVVDVNKDHTYMGMKSAGILGVLDQDQPHSGLMQPINPREQSSAGTLYGQQVPPTMDSRNMGMEGAGRAADTAEGNPQFGTSSGYGGRTTGAVAPGGVVRPGTTGTTGSTTLLPDGVDIVMPFAPDNSLIVRGTEEGIAAFKDLVHRLDVPPKQVNIKAEFVEVSTTDVKNLGIDWSLETLNETINTNFGPLGNVVVGFQSGNLAAQLRTELTRTAGKVINSPIVSTINNEPASIQIGSSIPYWTSSVVSAGTAGSTVATNLQYMQVTTSLDVLPRVNGDGTITLTLMPSVQDTGSIYTSPDGATSVPAIKFQTLYTRRRVMNNETIVVGGFIRKNDTESVTQIPLLGSLPIIGPLFRSTAKNGQDSELLIFVTPTIIGERAAGSSVGIAPTP